MDIRKFQLNEKQMTLYKTSAEGCPLVVLNTYTGDGSQVAEELIRLDAPAHDLLVVGGLDWNRDMCPWDCPPLSKNDAPCTGGADEYLNLLLTGILPRAKQMLSGEPAFTAIAGYSLAGLFALYALYKTDAFERAASMSGSLWFPDFREFALENKMLRKPDKLYISLGDREAKTRQPLLKTVQNNTEAIVKHYRSQGIDLTFELNEGNHFKEPELRSAKGIKAVL